MYDCKTLPSPPLVECKPSPPLVECTTLPSPRGMQTLPSPSGVHSPPLLELCETDVTFFFFFLCETIQDLLLVIFAWTRTPCCQYATIYY